jgi:hypothetical protein
MAADWSYDYFVLNGDANHDRTINTLDFTALAQNFNNASATFSQGDFNYDGVVNVLDFNILATKFGTSLAPPVSSPLVAHSLVAQAPTKEARFSDLFGSAKIDDPLIQMLTI